MQKFPIDSHSNENFISPFFRPPGGEDTSGTRVHQHANFGLNRPAGCREIVDRTKKTYSKTNTSPFALMSEWQVTTQIKPHHHNILYLLVALAQTNVFSVSNNTALFRRFPPIRWQLLSLPQLHRPGKTKLLVRHSGTYMWLFIRLSVLVSLNEKHASCCQPDWHQRWAARRRTNVISTAEQSLSNSR